MNESVNSQTYPQEFAKSKEQDFITKTFGWMALGLIVTAISAYLTVSTPPLISAIAQSQFLFFGLIIGELALVFYISTRIRHMSSTTAILTFLLYSALNGLTLSVILLIYTAASVAGTFLITAGLFGVMALYGAITKKDLTSIGSLAFMFLIGIILASILNIFFFSETVYWIITYAGVIVFCALTAYDTQKLKHLSHTAEGEHGQKLAIVGALALYLDFINLFLFLLRIFGSRD